MMDITTSIGLAAGTLTTISAFPQVIKAWKTRHTKDISLGMYMLLLSGVILWLIYGILRKDTPVIIANALTAIPVGTVLILKIRYG